MHHAFTQFCGEWHRYCMLEWMDRRLRLGYSLQFHGVPLFLWFCQRSKLLLSGEERFLLSRDSELLQMLAVSVVPHDKEGSVLRTYFLVPMKAGFRPIYDISYLNGCVACKSFHMVTFNELLELVQAHLQKVCGYGNRRGGDCGNGTLSFSPYLFRLVSSIPLLG